MLHDLRRDLLYSLRSFRKQPGFTAMAVLILALGIGANTAIFSAIHGVLLAPLPFPEGDRLVQVWNTYPLMNLRQASVSIPDYLDRREQVPAFAESAVYHPLSYNLSAEGRPERVLGVRTTATLFPMLGVRPAVGRVFGEEEEVAGKDTVVVLSHDLWQRLFAGDPDLENKQLELDGVTYRVLGVMPEGFVFPNPDVDLWRPFVFSPEMRSDDARGNEFSRMLARLAPGATLEQAQGQIDRIHEANKERFPEAREFWENSGFGGVAVAYRDEVYGDLRSPLLLLQLVTGLVLLIACANLANLQLARLSSRRRELVVRSVLGAGGWRLARQLLSETLLLTTMGAMVGLWLGLLGRRLLSWLQGLDGPAQPQGLPLQVLLFAAGIAILAGLVSALMPLISLARGRLSGQLNASGFRGTSSDRASGLPRKILVVAEVALAMLMLAGAALLLRGFASLQQVETGFQPRGVLTAQVSLPNARYSEDHQVTAFWEQALQRLRAMPEVHSAGLISNAPFSRQSSSGSYSIVGYEPAAGESAPHALIRVADSGFFQALDIQLLQGRLFGPGDEAGKPLVAVVDRQMVDKYFPEGQALGAQLRRGGPDSPTFEIVGVVENIKTRSLEQPLNKETLYVPVQQLPRNTMSLVVKTEGDPSNLAAPLRATILELDPALPTYNVTTLQQFVQSSLQTQRVSMTLVSLFGALALALAAVGLYALLAFTVGRRVPEIGTRMALGAHPGQVLGLILRQGMGLVAIGLLCGLIAALALGPLMRSWIYGIPAYDPLALGSAAAILALVAVLACCQPAWRAARVDPARALRRD